MGFHWTVEQLGWWGLKMSGDIKKLEGGMGFRRCRGLKPREMTCTQSHCSFRSWLPHHNLRYAPVHVSPHFPTIQKIRTITPPTWHPLLSVLWNPPQASSPSLSTLRPLLLSLRAVDALWVLRFASVSLRTASDLKVSCGFGDVQISLRVHLGFGFWRSGLLWILRRCLIGTTRRYAGLEFW